MKNIKRLATLCLALVLVMACSVGAFAADPEVPGTQDVDTADGSSTIPVVVTVEAPVFKAVVPVSLPVSVMADGTVITADNASIKNQSSFGSIKVTSVEFTATTPWEIKEFTDKATFGQLPVNSKVFGFKVNNCSASTDGAVNINSTDFPIIHIGAANKLTLAYDMLIAPQSIAFSAEAVGSVVITIGWAD